MAGRREDAEAAKVRRQKIFIAIGAVALIGILAFELPGLLSSGSSSGSGSAEATTPPAVPLAQPAPASAAAATAGVAIPHNLRVAKPRDLFVPQVHPQGQSTGNAPSVVFPKAPSVRRKDFVTKDMFVPQIKVAPAPVAVATTAPSNLGDGSSPLKRAPAANSGGYYIIVLGVVPGRDKAAQKSAARSVVAAKNAGLKDVVANNTLGNRKGPHSQFTIFTGPYTTSSGATTELKRAHRNGYPGAYTERLTSTPIGGF